MNPLNAPILPQPAVAVEPGNLSCAKIYAAIAEAGLPLNERTLVLGVFELWDAFDGVLESQKRDPLTYPMWRLMVELELLGEPTIARWAEMPYDEYLKTDGWDMRRRFIRDRDKTCVLCGTAERLHVHHRTYEHRGYERADELTTVCADCHRQHHGK